MPGCQVSIAILDIQHSYDRSCVYGTHHITDYGWRCGDLDGFGEHDAISSDG